MWVLLACGSAVFAGVTAIFAKIGIRNTDSTLATALRTVVVLIFAWIMVFIVGSAHTISEISTRTLVFLVLSGLATGAAWLCYFRALQLGNVNEVVPIDKSSTVLTILLAFLLLGEPMNLPKIIGMVGIGAGTLLMVEKKPGVQQTAGGRRWLVYAVLSAVFTAMTAILSKLGIEGVESNLGSAIRTCVVLIMAWIMVFITKKQTAIRTIEKREWLFLILSGLATGGSWLCYYRALQLGPASIVVPIDKLSILVTVIFSYFVFHEKLTKRSGLGLALIVVGTLVLALF